MCKCNNIYRDDKLHHECGVLGIYGVEHAAGLAYYGLHALQHRGQQGCGIVTVSPDGEFHRVKGDGPADAIHALATAMFLWFLSEPMLEKLDRVKVKYGLVER